MHKYRSFGLILELNVPHKVVISLMYRLNDNRPEIVGLSVILIRNAFYRKCNRRDNYPKEQYLQSCAGIVQTTVCCERTAK